MKKKQQMPSLFSVELEDPEEVKSTKFISKLQSMGFIGKNTVYLQNYINADIAIAFSHIKQNYKTYVLKGNWSEKKFEEIIFLIAKNRRMLIPNSFLQYGAKYDEGKLEREISIERKKYEQRSEGKKDPNKVSKEKQELLDYIARNGGLS